MSSPWASSVSHSATGLPCSQVLGCKGFLLQSPPPLSFAFEKFTDDIASRSHLHRPSYAQSLLVAVPQWTVYC